MHEKRLESLLCFLSATTPKVQGSFNLHALPPHDMDFFILKSSATGITGNRSQANYAADNTFQDFLAHYRRTQGLPASSIDLVRILSVGYVEEQTRKHYHHQQQQTSHRQADGSAQQQTSPRPSTQSSKPSSPMPPAQLEYPNEPPRTNCPRAQLVTGLDPHTLHYLSTYRARGIPSTNVLYCSTCPTPLFTNLRRTCTSPSPSPCYHHSSNSGRDTDADARQHQQTLAVPVEREHRSSEIGQLEWGRVDR
ncbi:MAG: hypothetical protein Q9227_005053 [Pyrenula ochraceoflavens]